MMERKRREADPRAWRRSHWNELESVTDGRTLGLSSLSTSGETLTIEESMNLEGENGERRNVGDEHE